MRVVTCHSDFDYLLQFLLIDTTLKQFLRVVVWAHIRRACRTAAPHYWRMGHDGPSVTCGTARTTYPR